ncbi:hypothetical protein P152DRAFT_472786 [Eremomyces bilateralis CBS 781.70]|uniref:Uncharacterized protein n=1 Tax=Eremomyces bilateralis CBS 781.70 TaxID=1392243 RepID=A0A6G1G7I9_9PEZI|nr:uncharacterized protein P152DRAFT_472786 [Eremomyces bilateralis CBS 781.70]KAF1814013.1 hypothetical protein P152DRAFT_472786 [Eremomyces bilateralis CBS 781.70]
MSPNPHASYEKHMGKEYGAPQEPPRSANRSPQLNNTVESSEAGAGLTMEQYDHSCTYLSSRDAFNSPAIPSSHTERPHANEEAGYDLAHTVIHAVGAHLDLPYHYSHSSPSSLTLSSLPGNAEWNPTSESTPNPIEALQQVTQQIHARHPPHLHQSPVPSGPVVYPIDHRGGFARPNTPAYGTSGASAASSGRGYASAAHHSSTTCSAVLPPCDMEDDLRGVGLHNLHCDGWHRVRETGYFFTKEPLVLVPCSRLALCPLADQGIWSELRYG